LVQATAVLDAVLVGDVVDLCGHFVEIFFGPSGLHHFLVPTEGPLLNCLLDVLDFEAHLGLICGQLFEGVAAPIQLPPTFTVGTMVTHWGILILVLCDAGLKYDDLALGIDRVQPSWRPNRLLLTSIKQIGRLFGVINSLLRVARALSGSSLATFVSLKLGQGILRPVVRIRRFQLMCLKLACLLSKAILESFFCFGCLGVPTFKTAMHLLKLSC